eukprot:6422663-Prymnesium_polylepis.1
MACSVDAFGWSSARSAKAMAYASAAVILTRACTPAAGGTRRGCPGEGVTRCGGRVGAAAHHLARPLH